jgi:hypothetical protein
MKQPESSLRAAGAMLVACRLAGLSALEARYEGAAPDAQTGECGSTRWRWSSETVGAAARKLLRPSPLARKNRRMAG